VDGVTEFIYDVLVAPFACECGKQCVPGEIISFERVSRTSARNARCVPCALIRGASGPTAEETATMQAAWLERSG
jgi:hypothetical protein